MKTAVVLGCHRSGTSLVASMLSAMGVDMGARLMGPHPSQPYGHHEDLDFVRMNHEILADGGGTWDNPPEVDWQKFRPELVMLVTLKTQPELQGDEPRDGEWFGFKDPRTCLTAGCYHGYLHEPHYIVVDRDKADIVASLEWREGKRGDHWAELVDRYLVAREWFLGNVDAPMIRLRYEDLTDAETCEGATLRLAEFLGMGEKEAQRAASVVRLRKPTQGLIRPLPQAIESALAAVANVTVPYIIHLGDADGDLRDSCLKALPGARYVQIDAEWENAWSQLHGPVHALLVDQGARHEEVRGWAAKVRPGGAVVGLGLRVCHNWPITTWNYTGYAHYWDRYDRRPFLKKGDAFGTIGIGVPYFKPEYDFWRWWSWMLLKGLEPGDEFLNDESVRAPLPIPLVHNRLIARFLESDRDTLCLVEDDHVGDVEVLRQMRQKKDNWDFDIVCANYVNRREFPSLTGYGLGNKMPSGEILCVLNWDQAAKSGTQAVDGAAMGLVLIRRWVLDAMLAGSKPSETFWCEWFGTNSQDITFYWKAREVGAQAAVDRDAQLGHIARTVKVVDDFWAYREPGGANEPSRAT